MRYGMTSRPADAFQNLRRLNSFLDEAIGGFPFGGESGTLTISYGNFDQLDYIRNRLIGPRL